MIAHLKKYINPILFRHSLIIFSDILKCKLLFHAVQFILKIFLKQTTPVLFRNEFYLNTYFNNILPFKRWHYTCGFLLKIRNKHKPVRCVLLTLHVCNTPI